MKNTAQHYTLVSPNGDYVRFVPRTDGTVELWYADDYMGESADVDGIEEARETYRNLRARGWELKTA